MEPPRIAIEKLMSQSMQKYVIQYMYQPAFKWYLLASDQ